MLVSRSPLSRQNRWQLPLLVLGSIIATACCTALQSGTSTVSRTYRTRRLASWFVHQASFYRRAPCTAVTALRTRRYFLGILCGEDMQKSKNYGNLTPRRSEAVRRTEKLSRCGMWETSSCHLNRLYVVYIYFTYLSWILDCRFRSQCFRCRIKCNNHGIKQRL